MLSSVVDQKNPNWVAFGSVGQLLPPKWRVAIEHAGAPYRTGKELKGTWTQHKYLFDLYLNVGQAGHLKKGPCQALDNFLQEMWSHLAFLLSLIEGATALKASATHSCFDVHFDRIVSHKLAGWSGCFPRLALDCHFSWQAQGDQPSCFGRLKSTFCDRRSALDLSLACSDFLAGAVNWEL